MESLYLAYVLIGIGILLLVAEMFVPSWGMFFIVAICAFIGGVYLLMQQDSNLGLITLLALVILVPVSGGIMLHYWPRTPIGRRLMLSGPEEDATVASMPVNIELEQLRGRVGRTLSPLRPSGVADFEGRRIDVLSEGMMIDTGTWVRCIDVRAGRVVVRAMAGPDLSKLENADLS